MLDGYKCDVCGGDKQIDGVPCRKCRGSGLYMIQSCPQKTLTPDVWAVFDAADDARRGFLPVVGGSTDQAASAMAAIRLIWAEEAAFRAEAGMVD